MNNFKVLDLKRVNHRIETFKSFERKVCVKIAILFFISLVVSFMWLGFTTQSITIVVAVSAFSALLINRRNYQHKVLARYLQRFEYQTGLRHYKQYADPRWDGLMDASEKRTLVITITEYHNAVKEILHNMQHS